MVEVEAAAAAEAIGAAPVGAPAAVGKQPPLPFIQLHPKADTPSRGTSSVGVIVGIVIGALAVVILIALLFWYIRKRRSSLGMMRSLDVDHKKKKPPTYEEVGEAEVLRPPPSSSTSTQDQQSAVPSVMEPEKAHKSAVPSVTEPEKAHKSAYA